MFTPPAAQTLALCVLVGSCTSGSGCASKTAKTSKIQPIVVDASVDTGRDVHEGTPWTPPLNPRAIGTFDLSKVGITAFSQTSTSQSDPQVLALAPDLVPRAWNQWDRTGMQASDYATSYPAACRTKGTRFVGGLTASVIFADQMTAKEFADRVGRNAAGEQVAHSEIVPGAFRGSLASPGFRRMLIDIAKLQIDAGVDGLFFDEVNASYTGATYDGNEGFDDYHVADFGRFLCARFGNDAAALAAFDLEPSDELDCTADDPGADFDYRGYLARHGWQATPLSSANRLAAEWGATVQNRPDPSKGTFVETYSSLVYWQEIVLAVRAYAREQYDKEILITANGVFPFVDFQSVGLYDWNKDGVGPRGFDYVPVVGGHLDGKVSFLPVLSTLKAKSKRIVEAAGGHEVPLLLFLDWPTDSMDRYYALPLDERKDYVRILLAESSALGMWFALPLATTTDSKTATALGMMDFFQGLVSFYRAYADLFRGGHDSDAAPEVSASGVAAHLVTFDSNRAVIHLVNHNYSAGFQPQAQVSVTVPLAKAPTAVTLVSPDLAGDQPATFSFADGKATVQVGTLVSSLAVVIR